MLTLVKIIIGILAVTCDRGFLESGAGQLQQLQSYQKWSSKLGHFVTTKKLLFFIKMT